MVMPMTPLSKLLSSEKIRFAIVGAINTAVDFSVLFLFASVLNAPIILSNILSTSAALTVSYLLNKKAVFDDKSDNKLRQILLFVGITLTGIWGLQGIIIVVLSAQLNTLFGATWALFVAKAVATVFSLIWNYVWYSKVVFRKKES